MQKLKDKANVTLEHATLLQNDFNNGQVWRTYNRNIFIKQLENYCIKLNVLYQHLDELSHNIKQSNDSIHKKLEFEDKLKLLKNTSLVLERNLNYEKQKKDSSEHVINSESDFYSTPELYDYLENKSRHALLNVVYLLQRLMIYLNKEVSVKFEYETDKELLHKMLMQKEQELNELQDKYENLRRELLIGSSKSNAYIDYENAFNDNLTKIESNINRVNKSLEVYKKQLDYMHESYSDLKEELKNMSNFYSNFSSTSMELVTILKKERDYAMKLLEEMVVEMKELRYVNSANIPNSVVKKMNNEDMVVFKKNNDKEKKK